MIINFMKKLLIMMALGLGIVATANAQDTPQKGDFTTEVGFTPFKSSGDVFRLNDAMFKVRYFLTDKDAVRVKLNVGIDNSSETETSFTDAADKTQPYSIANSTTETTSKCTDFSFAVGYERHLKTMDRLDVYVGAEIGYGLKSYSGDKTTTGTTTSYDGSGQLQGTYDWSSITEYTDRNANNDKSSHYFKGGVFAGLDFYVYKSLYLGVELGISFTSEKFPNSYYTKNETETTRNAAGTVTYSRVSTYSSETGIGSEVVTNGNTVTTTPSVQAAVSNERTNTSLKFYVEPAIRLGWKF